jgi:hypothetical protein
MNLILKEWNWRFKLVREDRRALLIQTDWDYPKVASLFGWIPCPCGHTDGTIRCEHRTPRQMIVEAYDFLKERIGASVEDPGYF